MPRLMGPDAGTITLAEYKALGAEECRDLLTEEYGDAGPGSDPLVEEYGAGAAA